MGGSPSTNGRADLAGLLDRLGHEAVKVRELITEAHGVIRDLTQHIREAKRAAKVAVETEVEVEVKRQLDEMTATMNAGREEAVQRITRSFDDLAAILLGFDYAKKHPGTPTIPEFVKRATAPICPGCGEAVESFTSLDSDNHEPETGSIAICWLCSTINVYANRYTLRPATAAEVEQAMAMPYVRRFFEERPNHDDSSMNGRALRSWLDKQS